MGQIGKILVALGLAIALVGGVLWLLGHFGVRRLPGDWVWRSDGMTVVIPLGTCLLLSVILTLLLWLWQWLQK
jgi:multisubunit Na+/H+ antiporter MnhG subunit